MYGHLSAQARFRLQSYENFSTLRLSSEKIAVEVGKILSHLA